MVSYVTMNILHLLRYITPPSYPSIL